MDTVGQVNQRSQARGDVFLFTMQRDESFISQLATLNSQVVGEIYDRYYPDVYRYALYRVNDESVAEDIASDVFVRLLEAAQSKKGPDTNLKGWLFATASHVVNDHLRIKYRRPVENLSEALPDETSNIHDKIDLREKNRKINLAYQNLTSEQQHVIALRFGQGYSLEETAKFLKKKVNAVKALQFRALASLQRLIGEVDNE